MTSLAAQVFGAVVRARGRAYDRGLLGVARLARPVVSIGNLSVGGSGKTPTVIALGQALQRGGLPVDVLSRGYRRRQRGLAIAATGEEDVALVGDEPKLIAQRLRAPVVVHPDRFRAGLEAEHRYPSRLHLLDDGFQHRALHRSFDLVLLAPGDLDDRLLPAGRLREPPEALARAHALLWLGDEAALAAARPRLQRLTPAPVFLARKRPLTPGPAASAGEPATGRRWGRSPQQGQAKPVAFCALARPESFWAALSELGITPVARRAFRDHHRYSMRDLARLRRLAQTAGASGLVTTAKDEVNLAAPLPGLSVVEIVMEIPAITDLIALIRQRCAL